MINPIFRAGLLAALLLLIQAGSTMQPTVEQDPLRLEKYRDRAAVLSSLDTWALSGRLAVSDENDGGSGKLRWQESPGGSRMDFHGALGRGAWQMEANAAGAVLELADGSRYSANSVGELVREQLGWQVPVESLAWWVRGLEAPGDSGTMVLTENGTLSQLRQHGWEVEYGRYREAGGYGLPLKLTARQEGRTVKLAIREWSLGDP